MVIFEILMAAPGEDYKVYIRTNGPRDARQCLDSLKRAGWRTWVYIYRFHHETSGDAFDPAKWQ